MLVWTQRDEVLAGVSDDGEREYLVMPEDLPGEPGWMLVIHIGGGEDYAFTEMMEQAKAKAEEIEAGHTNAELEALGAGPVSTE